MTKAEIQKLWAAAHKKFPKCYVSVKVNLLGFVDNPFWEPEIFIMNDANDRYVRLKGETYQELKQKLEDCNELSDPV